MNLKLQIIFIIKKRYFHLIVTKNFFIITIILILSMTDSQNGDTHG